MGQDRQTQQTRPPSRTLDGLLFKASVWTVSVAIVGLAGVVWNNHRGVGDHASRFANVWTADYRDKIDAAIEYMAVDQGWRILHAADLAAFKAEVKSFMAPGDRFTPRDFDRGISEVAGDITELRLRTRNIEHSLAILSERIRLCEGRDQTEDK